MGESEGKWCAGKTKKEKAKKAHVSLLESETAESGDSAVRMRIRASSYVKYLLAVYLGEFRICLYFFQLQIFFSVIVMAAASIFVPTVFLMNYKNLYEEKKFEDLTAYMEQLLYSFKRRAKILTALEDTKLLFRQGESRLYNGIEYEIEHIQSQSEGNIYQEAFSEIKKSMDVKDCIRSMIF